MQAAAESYIGLVEAGVGLIPAGGGTKEMLARAVEGLPIRGRTCCRSCSACSRRSASRRCRRAAPTRGASGCCGHVDGITMNRERLMADAKAVALDRVREGYRPPAPRTAIPVGGDGVLAALKLGVHLAWRAGRISDHDAVVGRALASVLAGGSLPHQTTVCGAVPAGSRARGVPQAVRRAQRRSSESSTR